MARETMDIHQLIANVNRSFTRLTRISEQSVVLMYQRPPQEREQGGTECYMLGAERWGEPATPGNPEAYKP